MVAPVSQAAANGAECSRTYLTILPKFQRILIPWRSFIEADQNPDVEKFKQRQQEGVLKVQSLRSSHENTIFPGNR